MVPLGPAMAFNVVVGDVPFQPFGNVHVYELAPITAGMLYVTINPVQYVDGPEIALGCDKPELGATANVCAVEDVPQLLFAVTLIVPAVEPVELMLVVVEEPVHPFGNVHVYELAPLTGEMLYDTA